MTRRRFVQGSVLGSAGVAWAAGALGAQPAPGASETVAAPLPRGRIGKLEVSRMLLGGNLLTHFTHSRDLRYVYTLAAHYNTPAKILETLAAAEAHGINTLSVHTADNVPILDWLVEHREKHGGKIQWIICPTAPVETGLVKYREQVRKLVDLGTDAIYLWGVHADGLVARGQVDLLAQAVQCARDLGVPSGVGGHALDVVRACEKHDVPADFYLKTLHHGSYPSAKLEHDSKWCAEPEETVRFMETVKKPWIAFKTMAAGAISPESAFRYAVEGGADFVLAGMFDYEIPGDVRLLRDILAASPPRKRPWRA